MEIYLITNIVNGKRYVGQTVQSLNSRWNSHKTHARGGADSSLHRSMRKHGPTSFKVESLCQCPDTDALDKAEHFFIWMLGTQKKSLGYNLTSGGESPSPTAETREKLRAALKGKKRPPFSPEWIANMSKARKGKPGGKKGKKYGPLSESHRTKVSEAMKGRTVSIETRRKISAIAKVRGNNRTGTKHSEDTKRKMSSTWTPERRKFQAEAMSAARWLARAVNMAIDLGQATDRAEAIRAISINYIQEHAVEAERQETA
jgi:group I intron endonuclease